jgi:rhodanese-related sulfurtransferase/DNA-binding transcriptional ArsR family regulator
MGAREFKDALYGQLARIGGALAAPRRLELLELLAQGERSVETLADLTGMSVANTSRHLLVLRAACLVETRREGNRVFYRLADDAVLGLMVGLRDLASARLAEVERLARDYLEDPGTLEPVSRQELAERLRAGDVILIDVRPWEEYRAGHIPGALSLPVDELEHRLGELPTDLEVVAYCRGPYCVFASEAVRCLARHGYRARRLEDGLPEWRLAGLPVEASGG